MKLKFLFFAFSFGLLSLVAASAQEEVSSSSDTDFAQAVSLYERGMYDRAERLFAEIEDGDARKFLADGYVVLCAIQTDKKSYKNMMDAYIKAYPYSGLIPQMRFLRAQKLFDLNDYAGASAEYERLSRKQIYKNQVSEFVFKRAYCDFELGNYDRALTRFKEVDERPKSDYTAPAQYGIAYINYSRENFAEARKWFEKAGKDRRFSEIAAYYILECEFMQKNYAYVSEHGSKMFDSVPKDRQAQLARLISESYLVLGDVDSARRYYEINALSGDKQSDSDYFYAGSVLYAVKDWAGAVENFSKMTFRGDSLGQIADYKMAYSYIQLKNKVAAMDAFKNASVLAYDPVIEEDAFYNYAKLAFDLNDDMAPFNAYLSKYTDKKRGDKVYAYVAMGALYDRDYASAVYAYDKIDELDEDMVSNYMKANYLRANELINDGSWRAAVPCLKAAAYYSSPQSGFNQLAKFWLAEAYFRDGQYANAINTLKALYNISALHGREEADLITYNMAYCYFQQDDYKSAQKWFSEYLATGSQTCRKEALVRMGDSYFMQRNYSTALDYYNKVTAQYFNVNEIYPYYQAALSCGLLGKNAEKITVLEPVGEAEPSAAFYSEATFELGKAYGVAGDEAKSIACFNRLIDNAKDSTYIAMSLIELGTLARNHSRSDDALVYYKRVVEQMPLSKYAEDAMAAIEAIYQSQNDPQGYIAYIENIGKASIKTEQEKEMMIFNAAEQIFLSGNYEKALVSLQEYLKQYPAPLAKDKAEFYMAESYRLLGNKEKACDHYLTVIQIAQGSYYELALLRYADLSYGLQNYDDAYSAYATLLDKALIDSNKQLAKEGMMRSAYNGKQYSAAVDAAALVAESVKTASDSTKAINTAIKTEADYIKAKSYLAMSLREQALPVFVELAKDPRSIYGAEAAYIIISDCYDRGDFKEVENRVYAFSDAASPHQYWLAKSFVVLGDAFAEQGEFEQAKATFESVLEGYKPEKVDDVKDNIDLRINKLNELIAEQNRQH